jgi:hypothetical protein
MVLYVLYYTYSSNINLSLTILYYFVGFAKLFLILAFVWQIRETQIKNNNNLEAQLWDV